VSWQGRVSIIIVVEEWCKFDLVERPETRVTYRKGIGGYKRGLCRKYWSTMIIITDDKPLLALLHSAPCTL
jgi:hypothetical protein